MQQTFQLNSQNYHSRNHAFKDLTGERFGRLTVINYFFKRNAKGAQKTYWKCICDCGIEKSVHATHLMSGSTKSCGCIRKEGPRKTHNMTNTRFYNIWTGMKIRTKNGESYADRGIFLCSEWETFENFKKDMYAAYIEHISNFGAKDTSIDRIDNDDGYYPENCRWATKREQNFNTRKNKRYLINGEFLTLTELALKYRIPRETLFYRLKHWDIDRVERSLI